MIIIIMFSGVLAGFSKKVLDNAREIDFILFKGYIA